MNKVFYTSLILLLIINYKGYSQTIPNSGFENWTTHTIYEEVLPFSSTNVYSYLTNEQTVVSKTTDKHGGSYAAKLTVDSVPNNNIAGNLVLGSINGLSLAGGVPFNQSPDSLIAYVKYNLSTGDSVQVIVGFKKLGSTIAVGITKFGGTQNAYTRISIPITFLVPTTPDSMGALIGITSGGNVSASDMLYIDDISFHGTATPFPNGDFESWTPVTAEDPDSWFTSNFFTPGTPSVTKTTNKYSGTYAAQLVTVVPQVGNAPTGFMIDGKLGQGGPTGGQPVSLLPIALTGYYKYAPQGSDTGIAIVYFHKWNSDSTREDSIAEYIYYFNSASSYTPFTMPLPQPGVTPDSVVLGFAASDLNNDNITPTPGSMLTVDDISFQLGNGLNIPVNEYFKLNTLYPNPATELISLDYNIELANDITVKVYDVTGKVVKAISLGRQDAGKHQLDMGVADMPAGTYFYSFNAGEKEAVKKFTIAR